MGDNLIYIFGIERRSGTNFLTKLLLKHPQISFSKQPGEDFLMVVSDDLCNYINRVSDNWSTTWRGMDKIFFKDKLREALSYGLLSYLNPQKNKFLLTKTPSTKGIHNFFYFFPNGKAIIIVRDGRNLVESGVQSFGWNYEFGFKEWDESAQRISGFINDNSDHLDQFFFLKYEDLNAEPEMWLKKIFQHFEIPVDQYPFEEVRNLPIIGSSESSAIKGKVDWNVHIEKDESFRPNDRFQSWDKKLRERYNHLCGKMSQKFGYEVFEETKGLFKRFFR